MEIGITIKLMRRKKGWTQEELAEKVDINVKTVSRIENGERTSPKTLHRIFNALGMEDKLIDIDGNGQIFIKVVNDELLKELDIADIDEINNEFNSKVREAYELTKDKKYEEALRIYKAIGEIFKREAIDYKIAILYLKIGDNGKALNIVNKILENNIESFKWLYLKGVILLEKKDFKNTKNILEKLLEINEFWEIYNMLGIVYAEMNEIGKAIFNIKKAIEIKPNEYELYLNIAKVKFGSFLCGDKEIVEHLDKAIMLKPNDYRAYEMKGEYYRFKEDYNIAIKEFRNSFKRGGNTYKTLLGLGLSLIIKNSNEGLLVLKDLFNLSNGKIFKNGNKVFIIDIGWKKIKIIMFEKINDNTVNIHIDNKIIPISLATKSFVFIGSIQLTDNTETMFYPMLGKVFKNAEEFKQVIQEIKKSISLIRMPNRKIYVNFENEIKVKVEDRKKEVYLEMSFGNKFNIIGVIENKNDSLSKFKELYKKFGQFRIHLECEDEIFGIDCIEEIEIK